MPYLLLFCISLLLASSKGEAVFWWKRSANTAPHLLKRSESETKLRRKKSFLKKAAKKNSAEANFRLAALYPAQRIYYLKEALNLDPEHTKARRVLREIYWNRYQETKDPKDKEVLVLHLHEKDTGENCYRLAKLFPKEADGYLHLAIRYGKHKKALKELLALYEKMNLEDNFWIRKKQS